LSAAVSLIIGDKKQPYFFLVKKGRFNFEQNLRASRRPWKKTLKLKVLIQKGSKFPFYIRGGSLK